jgi:hypothetical protein
MTSSSDEAIQEFATADWIASLPRNDDPVGLLLPARERAEVISLPFTALPTRRLSWGAARRSFLET